MHGIAASNTTTECMRPLILRRQIEPESVTFTWLGGGGSPLLGTLSLCPPCPLEQDTFRFSS